MVVHRAICFSFLKKLNNLKMSSVAKKGYFSIPSLNHKACRVVDFLILK